MTVTEKLHLIKAMEAHNADAIANLLRNDVETEIARKRAENAMPIGWKVKRVHRSQADLATLEAKLAKPLTDEDRARRRRDREILRKAYELDAAAYTPTPLQQRWEVLMTLLWMYRQQKKARSWQ